MEIKRYSRKYIGKTFITNEGYEALVIDGGSKKHYCTVEIDGIKMEVQVDNLKKGKVKYPYHPTAHGIGYVGIGSYRPRKNGKDAKEYTLWRNMMARCYNQKFQEKHPTYANCSVDSVWYNFQVFAEWYDKNHRDGFALDKDLLVKGNKVYSPDTCTFIPRCLNNFVANKQSNNISGYIGVIWHKRDKKWYAFTNDIDTHKKIHLGSFETPEEASEVYKRTRTTMAHKLKHRMILEYGVTDLRILDAIDKL